MALTITIEGKGVIANADNTGTDTAGGSWGRTGSGGVAWGTTTDTYYYGTTAISMALSGVKNSWVYHDIGAGNELDFGASGTEENQFIYVWLHCPTIGLTDTLANEGVSIRVGSSTSDYRSFIVAGSNASNGWDGGWQCFVIDPTLTGSIADTGTPNLSSIRYIGMQGVTTATAKGDNFFISQIAVGSGLRITGTSTTAWQEAVNYCTDLTNRAWGMLQEREGIYYVYGNMNIGDPAMSANCSFDDEARVVQFGISEYWSGTGTTFQSSLPATACGITLEDDNVATTYTTSFIDGVIVGTDNGRSGSTFIGNANENVFFDASGLANAGSVVSCYGSTFRSFAGAITLKGDTDHDYFGVSWVDCAQVDPVGGPAMRNCTFAETQSTTGALLWNSSIDIQDSAFIANTTGEGIEHDTIISVASGSCTSTGSGTQLLDTGASFLSTVAVNDYAYNETDGSYAQVTAVVSNTELTTAALTGGVDNTWQNTDNYSVSPAVTYTNLVFAGNTSDVTNSATGSDALFISKSGTSNPATSTGTAVFLGSVPVSVTIVDQSGDPIQNVQTSIYLASDDSELLNTTTNTSGVASTSYTGATPANVYIRWRKSSTGSTRYFADSATGVIASSTGLAAQFVMRADDIAQP